MHISNSVSNSVDFDMFISLRYAEMLEKFDKCTAHKMNACDDAIRNIHFDLPLLCL